MSHIDAKLQKAPFETRDFVTFLSTRLKFGRGRKLEIVKGLQLL